MTQHHFEHNNATPAEGANRADRHPPLDKPSSRLRAVNWLIGALVVMLAAYVASNLIAMLHIRGAATPVVHQARGVIDSYRADRGRSLVFRLSRPGAEPISFTCTRRANITHAPCPSESTDWAARAVTVDWIDLPLDGTGEIAHRATRIADAREVLFEASVADLQEAEASADVFAIEVAGAIFVPIILILVALTRAQQRFEQSGRLRAEHSAARVAAARQRSKTH